MPNKNHALVGLFALTAIGIGSLCISVFANEQQQRTIMHDPRRDMITTLEARGPHPSIGDQAQTFDRFVGTWDCDYASFKEDGTTEHAKGEVIFGWVLDGRAVQDIWTWIDKDTSGGRKLGTTVRFFDPKIGMWRIVWIDPVSYAIKILIAIGDRIVLEYRHEACGCDGRLTTSAEFIHWRGESPAMMAGHSAHRRIPFKRRNAARRKM